MQKEFPGFYPLKEDKMNLLDNATIVLDTDALLDLFRLSSDEAMCFLELVEKVKDKLWLPYDVAWLYHKRMNEEIQTQIDNVNSVLSYLANCKKDVAAVKRYPYLKKDLEENLQEVINKISSVCGNELDYLSKSLKSSDVKEKVKNLFDGKIGVKYENGELESIYKIAEERYKNSVPPGYESEKNVDERIYYHDLIVWDQILKYAKEGISEGSGIILVTGKIKRGWYYVIGDKIISTRSELINEFMEKMRGEGKESNKYFFCLPSCQFVEKISPEYRIALCVLDGLKKHLKEEVTYSSLNAQGLLNNQIENSSMSHE